MVIENGVLRKARPIVNLTEEQRKILRLPRRRMIQQIVQWGAERNIPQQLPDKNSFVKNIVSELGEYIDHDKPYSEIDAICDIIVFCITELPKHAINPELALAETYKEISSRTGAWSDAEGKWLKYKTPEAMALWYEADYSKCYYQPASDLPDSAEVPRDTKAELEDMRQDLLNESYGKL